VRLEANPAAKREAIAAVKDIDQIKLSFREKSSEFAKKKV
jgi:hypothetical protein